MAGPRLALRQALLLAPPLRLESGTEVPVTVRVSARARRVALRLHAGAASVELVLPEGASLAEGLRFLDSRRGWAASRLAPMPASVPFVPDARIPVLGRERRVVALPPRAGHRPFRLTDTTIEVAAPPMVVPARVQRGLAGLAQKTLAERARRLALALGRPLGKVAVGDPRTRWGSCSASGDIRFSWRLILAPECVLDYVAAHEVAHLAEMSHGPRFWRLVAKLHPTHLDDRAWLRRHGAGLHRYGGAG